MAPLESGGVLLGWQDACGVEVVVAEVLGPGPGASHRRARFSPDSDWQRAQIARAYEASGRVLSYLGDWHSHPGGGESPSRRDERTAHKIARSRAARAHAPVMLILPGNNGRWRPTPYQLVSMRLQPMESVMTYSADAITWRHALDMPSV